MWEKISKWFFLVLTAIGAIVIFYLARRSGTLEEEIRELRRDRIKEKIYGMQDKLDKAEDDYQTKREAYLKQRTEHLAHLAEHSLPKRTGPGDTR